MRTSIRPFSSSIGLEVGVEAIKLLQLETSVGGVRVAAALRVAFPNDIRTDPDRRSAFVWQTVRSALQFGAFRGPKIAAALPKDLVHYTTHRLPMMPPDEMYASARIDARDLFRFDPDSAEVQCLDAGDALGTERRREVILVAAGKDYVNQFVQLLHNAGAVVTTLGIDPCAIWRGVGVGDSPMPRALLDVGAVQSRMVIGIGDRVRCVQTIDVGAEHFRLAIARTLGLSDLEAERLRLRAASPADELPDAARRVLAEATRHPAERLAKDVLKLNRYHGLTFGGPSISKIETLGGAADDATLRAVLSERLSMPCKPIDLFEGIDSTAISSADRSLHGGEWAVALGMAMKDLPAETLASVGSRHRKSAAEPKTASPAPVLDPLAARS